jgi:hypothetical protein
MGNFYNSKDISEMKSRFNASRTMFVTTVSDHKLEDTMKESLNRIDDRKVGKDDEQSRTETPESEDAGDIRTDE